MANSYLHSTLLLPTALSVIPGPCAAWTLQQLHNTYDDLVTLETETQASCLMLWSCLMLLCSQTAMSHMSNELMLLGVATLVLLALQKDISKICGTILSLM